jgi:hypothetical protein
VKRLRFLSAAAGGFALTAFASAAPTLNGWDTSQIYVIRTSIYSYGEPELPANAIQIVNESDLVPPKPLTRFGSILVYDDLQPKTLAFSKSATRGVNSPRGARMFLAQAWPEGGRKTDIEVLEYEYRGILIRRSLLGATFGAGGGQLVLDNQLNNLVSIGGIRYNPKKNTLAVGATLVTNNGATVRAKALEFALPDWPAGSGGNAPATPVTPVQAYEAPTGHAIVGSHPANIDFDDDGHMYMTGRSFNANGIGDDYKSDLIKVNTIGLNGGLTPHVISVTGANAGNLLIEGSLEHLKPPENGDYGQIYSLAVRTAAHSIILLPRIEEVAGQPSLEYDLTARAGNGNLLLVRNWFTHTSGLGYNSAVVAGQRDPASGAVFVACERGDPGGGPKSINADGRISVIGWRNWDSASPPAMPPVQVTPDTDGDNDVDQADFGALQACLSGDGTLYDERSDCGKVDFDTDRDVDLHDFVVFQSCISGPVQALSCTW